MRKNIGLAAAAILLAAGIFLVGISMDQAARSTPETHRQVQLIMPLEGKLLTVNTSSRVVGNILAEAGLSVYPNDQISWNSELVSTGQTLPEAPGYSLQFQPSQAMNVVIDGQEKTVFAQAATVGEVLWQAGVEVRGNDHVIPGFEESTQGQKEITLLTAKPIQIEGMGQSLQIFSSAASVGEALAEAGIALQSLDFSTPAEDEALPPDRLVQVTRVKEEIILEQAAIPFEREVVEASDLELDQREVIEAGQTGLRVSRVRVRYENGEEIARQTDAEWVAQEPVSEKLGYGTKVVVKTLDTPQGPLEYWRAVNVYATSYSPCRSGGDRCYSGTSSGMKVQRGAIGVTRQWYNLMAGQRLYVPGYGVGIVADVGGGVPGKHWIDLGFSDEDFEAWHQNVTIYFLTPVPTNIAWILP